MLAEALNINYSGGGTEVRSAAVHAKPVVFFLCQEFLKTRLSAVSSVAIQTTTNIIYIWGVRGKWLMKSTFPKLHNMKYYGGIKN